MNHYLRSIFLIAIGACCIGFSPALTQLAILHGLSTSSAGFWRVVVGCLSLFAIGLFRRKSIRLGRRPLLIAFIAGFIFACDLFFWHRAMVHVGSGMSTVLGNTQVFFSALLGYFILKERVSLSFFAAAILAIAGICLLVGIGSTQVTFSSQYLTGIGFGFITALTYGCFLIAIKIGKQTPEQPDTVVFMAWISLFSALFLGLAAGWEQGTGAGAIVVLDLIAIAAVLGLGVVIQALAWWTIASALPNVPTALAGLILLLQPIFAVLWGKVIFGESLTTIQVAGAIMTIGALYWGSVKRRAQADTKS